MNVLILTDFSVQAYNAARYALSSTAGPSNFFLLHASTAEAPSIEGRLLDMVAKLKKEPTAKNHNFSVLAFSDNLINATRKSVVEKQIDLIVMGASGKNTSKIQGLGGNTCNVAKKVKCPILVVPNCSFKSWENIYLPLDLRFPVNTHALQLLQKLPVTKNAKLNVWEFDLNNLREKIDDFKSFNYKLERRCLKKESDFFEKFWPEANAKAHLIVFFARQLHITDKLLNRLSTMETQKQSLPVLILHG